MFNYNNFEDQKGIIGYTIFDTRIIYEKDIMDFARLSGDYNPIHVDDLVASQSVFKKRIAHGMYIASFFSKILGDKKYGYEGIYINQELKFIKPVYIGDTVDICVELVKIEKSIFTFKTYSKVNDKIVIDGLASIFVNLSKKYYLID